MAGNGEEGKLCLGHLENVLIPTEIEIFRGMKYICASGGAWHSLFLFEDEQGKRRVFACGSNYWRQLGAMDNQSTIDYMKERGQFSSQMPPYLSHLTFSSLPVEIKSLQDKKLIKVATGSNFSVALTADGRVYSWGCSSSGKTGHGTTETVLEPSVIVKLLPYKIIDVHCGSNHTFFLTDNNTVLSCGWSKYGQSGLGEDEALIPIPISSLKGVDVKVISCGAFYSICCTYKPKSQHCINFNKCMNKFVDCQIIFA